jgi:hypothetical protein
MEFLKKKGEWSFFKKKGEWSAAASAVQISKSLASPSARYG